MAFYLLHNYMDFIELIKSHQLSYQAVSFLKLRYCFDDCFIKVKDLGGNNMIRFLEKNYRKMEEIIRVLSISDK